MRTVLLLLGLVFMVPSAAAQATTSREFARMGYASWSAFECSGLASKMGDAAESSRLFNFGYEQGKQFLEAVRADKVQRKDVSAEVPVLMVFLLQGPSTDFILGRIYENALDSGLDDVFETEGSYNSEDVQKSLARSKYRRQNCGLLRGEP